MEEKIKLRESMKSMRNGLDPDTKQAHDQRLSDVLLSIINRSNAKIIHTYLPMGTEVNLFPLLKTLLQEGKTLVAPQALPKRKMKNWLLQSLDELESGIYGTQYPGSKMEYSGSYDLIIVPGLAFDKLCYRLGYGAGYYDHFLNQHPEAKKIGICYPFQYIDKVPIEEHDERLNRILF